MDTRKTYISNNDLSIFEKYLDSFNNFSLGSENIKTIDSLNRVTAEAIYAKSCDPNFNASAMDGICVEYEKTISASETKPLTLKKNTISQEMYI